MPLTAIANPDDARAALKASIEALDTIILGKTTQIKLAVSCLLANGHLLIEDVPGVGKTTMARALARVLGLDFARVQFTSDLLPADITGISVYQKDSGEFRFLEGPVFTQMLLADEINRATPKAQSALLEAMQEQQVTVDGQAYSLPDPFFVVAAQNPADQIGTFALPESQLDRFLLRVQLGYPTPEFERVLLSGQHQSQSLDSVPAALTPAGIDTLKSLAQQVKLSEPLLDYVQALLNYTRDSGLFVHGLSPRAGIALTAAARAFTLIEERNAVYPEDIQQVFAALAGHRLNAAGDNRHVSTSELVASVLDAVPIP